VQIECDIEGIDPQPSLFEFFERVLRNAAERVTLDPAMLGRVVIVSPDRFGAAIDSIRPGYLHTHTNTDIAVAVAKTMPRREGDRIVSDIVLQSVLFETLARVLGGSSPASHGWDVHQEQAIYVICHEFGHAIDHSVRNDASEVADPRANPFFIRETAAYYGNILLTEYAACRLSAPAMTDRLFSHETKEAEIRIVHWARVVRDYLDNPASFTPRARAHVACQGAWLYMVELAKLYGYADAVQARDAAMRQIETDLLNETPLCDYLAHLGTTYPAWDLPREIGDLTVMWLQYAALSGVEFVASADGPDEMVDLA
jgi:hypothetical protein